MGYITKAFLQKQFEDFAARITSVFARKTEIPDTPASFGGGYGTCSTAANTAAKAAVLPGYKLAAGGIVSIKFDYNVPASATLNINNTGAKPIWYQDTHIAYNEIEAGRIATFRYDGQYYRLLSLDKDDNTVHAKMLGATEDSAGAGGLVPQPAAGDQDKFLRGDGVWATPADYSITVQTEEPAEIAENEIVLVVEG